PADRGFAHGQSKVGRDLVGQLGIGRACKDADLFVGFTSHHALRSVPPGFKSLHAFSRSHLGARAQESVRLDDGPLAYVAADGHGSLDDSAVLDDTIPDA